MRKRREWYEGAIYHIMQRGVRRTELFRGDADFQVFLAMLQGSLHKYECTLHAYCLMTNHYHMLVETADQEISKFVQCLSHSYAMYFNQRYGYRGHVFEGRFVSGTVRDDNYFIQASRYIHLNPVKAHIVQTPEQYQWSSYRALGGMECSGIVSTDKTLAYFGTGEAAVMRYREFVRRSGEKYTPYEEGIRKEMDEDELWLPG